MTYHLYIAGKPVGTTQSFDVINPTTGAVIAACPLGTPDDVDAAVSVTKTALPQRSDCADGRRQTVGHRR